VFIVEMSEDRLPTANEKNVTPNTITDIEISLSALVLGLMSPYPTVDKVMKVQ
jgi:hypothetical protein